MDRDELVYLRHILDAINTVEEYLRDVSEKQFKANGYFGVDIEKVWDTAQQDLPILKEQVLGILEDFGQQL